MGAAPRRCPIRMGGERGHAMASFGMALRRLLRPMPCRWEGWRLVCGWPEHGGWRQAGAAGANRIGECPASTTFSGGRHFVL